MIKVKNSITLILLVAIVLFSSLIFISCGKAPDNKGLFTSFQTTIENYKQSGMLGKYTIKGITSNFYLQDFKTKSKNGSYAVDDENHIAFIAIGLNYIEQNYPHLENIQVKYNYSAISEKLKEMNEAYNDVLIEYKNMKNLSSDMNYNIYNGHFARYKLYAQNFIDSIYEVAEKLGDFLVNHTKLCESFATEDQSEVDTKVYMSYQLMLIAKDYKDIFINSCQGEKLSSSSLSNAQDDFDNYSEKYFAKMNSDFNISFENSISLKELLEAVNWDRKNEEHSIRKFSFFEYCINFEQSLSAYSKSNKNAETYYKYIDGYIEELGSVYNYLKEVIA